MKKFTFGMVGLVALIALSGQAKAYDQEITDSKCEALFEKAEKLLSEADKQEQIGHKEIGVKMHNAYDRAKKLKKESVKTFKKFEACQAHE